MKPRAILRRLAWVLALAAAPAAAGAETLIACGSDEVRIYDAESPASAPLWSWRASDEHGLPQAFREGLLTKIDECKPVLDGEAILITASTGGVALIDRGTGRARFWARAPQAHSAEILPGRRLVVAAAVAPQSNRLILFDIGAPERELFSTPLASAHGVVWDDKRRLLFADGASELRSYALEGWSGAAPALRTVGQWPLPGAGQGHDLSPLPGGGDLILTTSDNVWVFSPASGAFAPLAPLANLRNVKAVSVSARTGRIATQEPTEQWWSHAARLHSPEGSVPTPGINLYKVRWDALPSSER